MLIKLFKAFIVVLYAYLYHCVREREREHFRLLYYVQLDAGSTVFWCTLGTFEIACFIYQLTIRAGKFV